MFTILLPNEFTIAVRDVHSEVKVFYIFKVLVHSKLFIFTNLEGTCPLGLKKSFNGTSVSLFPESSINVKVVPYKFNAVILVITLLSASIVI
mgnify:FL=1|nr:MAG TPA: hypothetical protein [Bacteriophage sp.]